jgi:hypothetical protein
MAAWYFAHDTGPLTGAGAVTHLRDRAVTGELETWLRHDDGLIDHDRWPVAATWQDDRG